MKISQSILDNKELTKKLYINELDKAKKLLTDIFLLDFNSKSNIKNYIENIDELKFEIAFSFNDMEIKASFEFKKEQEMLLPILNIIEEDSELIKQEFLLKNEYKEKITNLIAYLERKYNVTFIHLDPVDKDENVLKIEDNGSKWEAIIKSDKYEGKTHIVYNSINEPKLIKIYHYKRHQILID